MEKNNTLITAYQINYNSWRGRHVSLSWFYCRSSFGILVELEFGDVVFVEGGKPEYLEKNPRSKDKNQQQTQPTDGNKQKSNPQSQTKMSGHQASSPLPPPPHIQC